MAYVHQAIAEMTMMQMETAMGIASQGNLAGVCQIQMIVLLMVMLLIQAGTLLMNVSAWASALLLVQELSVLQALGLLLVVAILHIMAVQAPARRQGMFIIVIILIIAVMMVEPIRLVH